MMVEKIKKKV